MSTKASKSTKVWWRALALVMLLAVGIAVLTWYFIRVDGRGARIVSQVIGRADLKSTYGFSASVTPKSLTILEEHHTNCSLLRHFVVTEVADDFEPSLGPVFQRAVVMDFNHRTATLANNAVNCGKDVTATRTAEVERPLAQAVSPDQEWIAWRVNGPVTGIAVHSPHGEKHDRFPIYGEVADCLSCLGWIDNHTLFYVSPDGRARAVSLIGNLSSEFILNLVPDSLQIVGKLAVFAPPDSEELGILEPGKPFRPNLASSELTDRKTSGERTPSKRRRLLATHKDRNDRVLIAVTNGSEKVSLYSVDNASNPRTVGGEVVVRPLGSRTVGGDVTALAFVDSERLVVAGKSRGSWILTWKDRANEDRRAIDLHEIDGASGAEFIASSGESSVWTLSDTKFMAVSLSYEDRLVSFNTYGILIGIWMAVVGIVASAAFASRRRSSQ